MKILVKASCSAQTNPPYCKYAVYTLGPEERRLLKVRRTLFGNAQEQDRDLHQLVFIGSLVTFYGNIDTNFLSKKELMQLEADDYIILPADFTTSYAETKTEMELIVIADDGFFCTAIPKYTDYLAEATGLSYEVLDIIPVIDIDPDPSKFDRVTGRRIIKRTT